MGGGIYLIHSNIFNYKNYIIDRGVRIYLPLMASIVLYFIICQILGEHFDILCAIGNLLNLQGVATHSLVSPFWSLAYEMWFYIALLGIALIMSGNRKWMGFAVMAVICLIFISGLDMFYLIIWFMGAFAWLVRPKKRNLGILSFAIALLGISVACSQILTDSHSINIALPIPINKHLSELMLTIAVCLIIQQLSLCKPRRKFVVRVERAFSFLASFSYTLYLSHRIFFLLLFTFVYRKGEGQFVASDMLSYMVFLLITLCLCYGLYRVSEYYTAPVKKYLKQKFIR